MSKGKQTPDWFSEEAVRAEEQASKDGGVNPSAPGGPRTRVKRVNKAFQVEEGRAAKWHLLVAQHKSNGRGHQSGPELIDEALDLLFEKHGF
ncbi:MAG: hypothetical protein AAFX06_28670 [Planctomycetota bacterium]